MKKLILFIAVAMAIAGCKKEIDKPVQALPATKLPCSPSIIISKVLLGGDYDDWKKHNLSLICDETNDSIRVDLSAIQSDSDNKLKAEWLEINGGKIDYTNSKRLLIDKHKIASNEIRSIVTTNKVKVSEIKSAITNYAFKYDKYNQYLEIKASPFKMTLINSFEPGTSFSIPFMRAILEGLDENLEVEILDAKIKDDTSSSEIRVWIVKIGSLYFNYSKWPAK